jgi:DNA-binding GntR family transcriptional regulator
VLFWQPRLLEYFDPPHGFPLDGLRSDLERICDGAYLEWPEDRLHATGVTFHEELVRMGGNPFLYQAIQRVNRMRRLLEYRSMIDRPRILAETREHLEILAPVGRGISSRPHS